VEGRYRLWWGLAHSTLPAPLSAYFYAPHTKVAL